MHNISLLLKQIRNFQSITKYYKKYLPLSQGVISWNVEEDLCPTCKPAFQHHSNLKYSAFKKNKKFHE